jgi:hypothetical protein
MNRYIQSQELLTDINFVKEVNFEKTSTSTFFAIKY